MVDPVSKAGEGEKVAVSGAVGVDQGPQLAVAVAGRSADPAGLGDGGEGYVVAGGEQVFAGGADAFSAASVTGRRCRRG